VGVCSDDARGAGEWMEKREQFEGLLFYAPLRIEYTYLYTRVGQMVIYDNFHLVTFVFCSSIKTKFLYSGIFEGLLIILKRVLVNPIKQSFRNRRKVSGKR
jgi:hypothetical protein